MHKGSLLRQGHLSEEETAVHVTSDIEGSLKQHLLHIPDEACVQSGLSDHFLAGQKKPQEQICGLHGLRVFLS